MDFELFVGGFVLGILVWQVRVIVCIIVSTRQEESIRVAGSKNLEPAFGVSGRRASGF